jgi:hypothetical protein
MNMRKTMIVAVIGSSIETREPIKALARDLGCALAERGFVIATGAGPGLSLDAALAAKRTGAVIIGFSPAPRDNGLGTYRQFDCIEYVGYDDGRSRKLIFISDAVVMLGGGGGTQYEFGIARMQGKPIGVLEGSGGISDDMAKRVRNGEYTKVVCSGSPVELSGLVHDLARSSD